MSAVTRNLLVVVAVALLSFTAFGLSAAQSPDGRQRLAILKALKVKGVVGENNKGLLEFRGAPAAQDVVNAENADRQQDYQQIAKSTKVAVADVGKRRAVQLAKDAPAGTWVQQPDGGWDKKK